jgi:hypothetical protein
VPDWRLCWQRARWASCPLLIVRSSRSSTEIGPAAFVDGPMLFRDLIDAMLAAQVVTSVPHAGLERRA